MTEGAAELVAQVIVGLMIALAIELRVVVEDYLSMSLDDTQKSTKPVRASGALPALEDLIPLLGFLFISLLSISSLAICLNAVIENRSIGSVGTYYIRFCVSAMACAVVIFPGMVFAFKAWQTLFPSRSPLPNWYFLLVMGFMGIGLFAVMVFLNWT